MVYVIILYYSLLHKIYIIIYCPTMHNFFFIRYVEI